MPKRLLVPSLLLLLGLASNMAAARRPKPVPCAPGSFALSAPDAAALAATLRVAADVLDTTPNELHVGTCSGRARIKATRKTTRITARLGTCGAARMVQLAATVAWPACDAARVTVRGKRMKRMRFVATRVVETPTTTTTLPGDVSPTTTTTPPGTGVTTTTSTLPSAVSTTTTTTTPAGSTTTTTTTPAGSTTTTTTTLPLDLPLTSQQLIADALRDGRIDLPTSLRYRAYALFGDPRLPAEFDGEGTTGEDTVLFLEVLRRWGELPAEAQQDLQPFLVRRLSR